MNQAPLIDGRTRATGIIGRPVAASRSPAMHNAAFAAVGLNWRYLAFDVGAAELPAAVAGAAALGFAGLNVTAPHKATAARLVDRLSGMAAPLGLVNTIVFDDGERIGHTTDGDGFVAAAREQGMGDLAGSCVVLVGAGGAAVSVAAALLQHGSQVVLLNRDGERLAQALASLGRLVDGAPRPRPAAPIGHLLTAPAVETVLAGADLVVNCVPPGQGPPPIDLRSMRPGTLVCDLAYDPVETPFLLAAAAAGAGHGWNGLGMLVHQGAESFALWTGVEAPIEVMAAAVGYRLAPRVMP